MAPARLRRRPAARTPTAREHEVARLARTLRAAPRGRASACRSRSSTSASPRPRPRRACATRGPRRAQGARTLAHPLSGAGHPPGPCSNRRCTLPDAEALCADARDQKLRPAVTPETGMVGIHTGGAWLAERLHRELGLADPARPARRLVLPRRLRPNRACTSEARRSQIPFDVDGRDIVLVDDVLYTGRTIRAAMNELFDYGRPRAIAPRGRSSTAAGGELPIARSTAARRSSRCRPGEDAACSTERRRRLRLAAVSETRRCRNPQLNANGELAHLLTTRGAAARDHRAHPRHRARRSSASPSAR